MTRQGRAGGFATAIILAVGGIVYSAVPFDHTLGFGSQGWSDGLDRDPLLGFAIRGECRPAVASATRDGPPLALWAVTVGTNMEGYTPVFGDDVKTVLNGTKAPDSGVVDLPDRACSTRARERLVSSVLFFGAALAIAFLTLRRSRVTQPIGRP